MPESQIFISWWGAGLSTLLAILKLAELWRNRFRIEISPNLTDSESHGNTIQIRNLSNKPIIITYWEIMYVSGRWPRRKFEVIAHPDHDSGDCRIESQSTLELIFTEQDYFSWSHKILNGRKIFIRAFIAGRRPILRTLYP